MVRAARSLQHVDGFIDGEFPDRECNTNVAQIATSAGHRSDVGGPSP
jgi:hypothetical protein